tara:strand:+ start:96 stop:2114 length:2019 start_codon:yes stop_codon:yes gene_type:complete
MKQKVKFLGKFLILITILLVLVISDIFLGMITNINTVKEHARLYRSEATYTIFSTKNIIPNTNNQYKNIIRPEGKERKEANTSRLFRSNHLGSIMPSSDSEKEKNNILFLGGSTVENNEVDEEFRFPYLVGKTLENSGFENTVNNLGVRGHSTIDSINVLLNRSNDFNPNYVILMHNINDRFRSMSSIGYKAKPGLIRPTSFNNVLVSAKNLVLSIWEYSSYQSNALFLLRFNKRIGDAWLNNNEEKIENYFNNSNNFIEKNKPDSISFIKNLTIFIKISSALDIEPILMTQALGYEDNEQNEFNEIIREVAYKENIALIDLDKELERPRQWAFYDDGIHLNNDGSIAVAKIITSNLNRLFKIKVSINKDDEDDNISINFINRCKPKSNNKLIKPGISWRILNLSGRYPTLSKNKEWLVYQEWRNGITGINLLNTKSGILERLTPKNLNTNERHPSILSSKAGIIEIIYGSGFSEKSKNFEEKLMIMKWPTGDRKQVTPIMVDGSIPSHNNEKIVFAGSLKKENNKRPDIFLFDIISNSLKKITDTPWEEWRPIINSNNNIIYISDKKGNFDLYSTTPNSEEKFLWGSSSDEWDPSFSPDGKQLVFSSKKNGNWDLFFLPNLNETKAIQLTSSKKNEWDPSFSPDGSFVIYAASSDVESSKLMGLCLYGDKF